MRAMVNYGKDLLFVASEGKQILRRGAPFHELHRARRLKCDPEPFAVTVKVTMRSRVNYVKDLLLAS